MIMKKLFSAILFTSLFTVSCNDVYDFGDDGTINYDIIFSDFKLTGSYLNKAYGYMPSYGINSAGGTFLACYTDEAQDGQAIVNSSALGYYEGRATSANNIIDNDLYNNLYAGIRICNIFLQNIDNATNMQIESYRSKWKGEAYLLRAYYYLQLIKRFGPVPIIKEDLGFEYDFSKMTRPTFYQNVQEIIKDCRLALDEPELPMRISESDQKGSMSKSVAYAIMSQAMLYAASPLWCDGNDYWDEAYSITKEAKDALVAAGFKLYNPAASVTEGTSRYQDYFLISPEYVETPTSDVETIYSQKGQIGAVWQNHGLPMMADVNKAGMCPSQELVDAYETLNGKPVLNPALPYFDSEHLEPNYNKDNEQYDPENPYANRDPRLLATIYYNGSYHNLNNETNPVYTYVGGNCGISQTNNLYTRTGYYIRKWVHYDSKKNSNKDGYWRHYRMAEIYLNFAEAAFYANGVTDEAVDALNETRKRARIPELPKNITPEEFEQRLRNERRVEFAFEEHRYYDVRRWKIQNQVEGVVTGMEITQNAPNDYSYKRILVQERNVTDEKYLMWPMPRTEENKYKAVGIIYQNPGW